MKKRLLASALVVAALSLEASYSVEHYNFDNHLVHVVTFDPQEYAVKLVDGEGLEKLESMAQRSEALVALSGGFYQSDGSPSGVFYSEETKDITRPWKLRGAIAWDEDFNVKFGRTIAITEDWQGYSYVLGGAPLLLLNGEIQDFNVEETRENFLTFHRARTAIGMTEDGLVVLAMAHGMDSNAVGFTVYEWASWLKELGVVNALNLVGGDSSALFVEGKLFAECDKKIGNALVVVEKP